MEITLGATSFTGILILFVALYFLFTRNDVRHARKDEQKEYVGIFLIVIMVVAALVAFSSSM